MVTRIVFGLIFILLIFLVAIPLGLRWAGFDIFSFSASTGTTTQKKPSEQSFGILARSENEGRNWKNAAISENPAIPFPGVIFSFVMHPNDANVLYIGSKGSGLWRSMNGGRTWNRAVDGGRVLDSSADVYDVEIAKKTPNIFYTAVFQKDHGRVLKSEDGGATWREVYATSALKTGVFDISVDPFNTDHILIATGENGLFESNNGGETWRVKKWFTEPLVKIIVNPRNAKELYLITSAGNILKSVTGGTQWGNLSGKEAEEEGVSGVAIEQFPQGIFGFFGQNSAVSARKIFFLDPTDPSRIYLSSSDGLLRSVDSGLTWKQLNLLLPKQLLPVTAIAINPSDSEIIYAGAGSEIHKSVDGGVTWSVMHLSEGIRVMGLIIHPQNPDIMFSILSK